MPAGSYGSGLLIPVIICNHCRSIIIMFSFGLIHWTYQMLSVCPVTKKTEFEIKCPLTAGP